MTKKILFIIDFSQNSVYFKSLAYAFTDNNYTVEFLFLCKPGILSHELEKKGIKCYCEELSGNIIKKTWKGIKVLKKLQKINQYNFIFSHLTLPNLICSFFQLIEKKAKISVCRHHSDMYYQENIKNGIRLDKIIQALAKNIVVISEKSKEVMIQQDKCDPNKITYLPLLYDFNLYNLSPSTSKENTPIKLVFVSRLVKLKKIQTIFPVIESIKLKNNDINPFQILIVGDGPFKENLIQNSQKHGLENETEFKGFINDPMKIINDSTILVLLSGSESSNQVVKEAGVLRKTVVACKNVGDFDTYLTHENAYLLEKEFTSNELEQLFIKILSEKEVFTEKGRLLKESVMQHFSIQDQFVKYLTYFS